MNTSTFYLTHRFILLATLSAIISCDSLTENDSIIPEKQVTFLKSNYYILPRTSVMIDLNSVVKESFLHATLMILENPARGTLTPINSLLYKYTPGREFNDGEDHFVIAVVNNGKVLAKNTLTINLKKYEEALPCALLGIEDKIKLKKTDSSSVTIAVLENDRLCDMGKSSLNVSIHTPPKFGQAIVDNEFIVYTPGPEYKHHDELIYQLTRAADDSIFYGVVSIDGRGEFSIQTITGREFTSLFFIDEDTGFLGTDRGVYKTIDGGKNWNVSLSNYHCEDIFFLNETKGFAVIEWDQIFSTSNGGVTWELLARIEKTVTTVVFTSETTGFISASNGTNFSTETSILKTEDGGVTWRKIFSELTYFGYLDIQFIDRNIGYAVFYERLYVTRDAGETWNLSLDKSLNHLEVTSENELFAVPYDDDFLHSSIITSEDGYQWRSVANLSFNILSLGFSPAADVGFASLFTLEPYEDPYHLPLSIVKTIDRGETWIEQNFDEAIYGFPLEMSIPSTEVVYFLCMDRIIKYSNK